MNMKKYFEEEYSNCRVKAVRDILLFYNVNIDIHLLFFLSLENVLSLGIVSYGNEKFPILTANNHQCDLKVLDSLNIKYHSCANHDIGQLLEQNKALIFYYSADELVSATKEVRTRFCGVSSAVIYENEGSSYHSSISFNKDYEWVDEETLQRVRFAPTIPFAPDGMVIMIESPENAKMQFDENKLMLAVGKNIENLIQKYNCELTEFDINECCKMCYGLTALHRFEKELVSFMDRLQRSNDVVKSCRLFRVWIRILYRFLDGGDNSETFYREEITKTINRYFNHRGVKVNTNKGDTLCEKWRDLIRFIGEIDKKHGLLSMECIEESISKMCCMVRECYLYESMYFEMIKRLYENMSSAADSKTI